MGDNGDEPSERRRSRWRGLVGISIVRLWRRATGTQSRRLAATVGAVALTIALLVVVTGVALGLADGGVVDDHDADVRIAPEDSTSLSAVDDVEEPRLGASHERTAEIRDADGVDHASPTLVELVELEADDGDGSERVLLVGVVPDDESRTVGGLPTDSLETGDSHYADGSYDGPRRGELVLSTAAADRLDAEPGDELAPTGPTIPEDDPVPATTVTAVEDAGDGADETPIALVHLSELQTLSGADDGELADQVLVWGETETAESAADEAYPAASVESIDRTNPSSLFDDGLAFATSLLALLVGVVVCTSFVATTAGMTVNEDRRTLAVLESVGYPTHSRLTIIAVSTLLTTLVGALVGVVLGVGGIYTVNAVASATVATGAVAAVHPVFVPYAVAVALVSGVVATPYPLVVAARTSVLEEVGR
ncbi:ABC transporter permease [Natronolimnohabitans sp. A-GB9]|uniref:FtsX-like permease family protein n=1 Tax=Natronolimnohabitans sp. A-GB9 TaxID=3069757 RepID=UPI0027B2690E|nr:FtsX-like permease family protein [Natronolimnohabitans sp. A-GB9]MDQ2048889.1 ABC transporter permease [Natronolimnohabitans sp. A-GB9]